jgi:Carbohydrate esterase, sialic acid-specific acetylesterase/Secretion system C-terminal sorting domain
MNKYLFLFFSFISFITYTQTLKVTYPSERMVLQRSNSNNATVFVSGTFAGPTDKIEARVIAKTGGVSSDWIPIEYNPLGGVFRGNMNVQGGWYSLEVRQVFENQTKATYTVNKFGVGEVFIIAGQSNAQGYKNFGNVAAVDDRVQHISNYYNDSGSEQLPPYPTFGHLEANSNLAPFGQGSWSWGVLGDLLTNRLNVPVCFINAAWEASTIDDWVESANGNVRFNVISGNVFPKGMPYTNLKNSLLNYGSITGFRSIIWHQGETDTEINNNTNNYLSSLSRLIQLTRTITGKNVSWLVSRASRFSPTKTSQQIIDAQTLASFQINNVFQGPNTDGITERFDGIHFSGNGLKVFANLLNTSMNDAFFANSSPQLASEVLKVSGSCQGQIAGQPINLSLQDGFQSYRINQSNTKDLAVGNGIHQGMAKDGAGNWRYSQPIDFNGINFYAGNPPFISAVGAVSFCPGGNVSLNTNSTRNVVWFDQTTGTSKVVSNPGAYNAYYFNEFGCALKSNTIQVNYLPSPAISITTDNPRFCPGQSITITSSSPINNIWSNGETTQSIRVSANGNYSVKLKNPTGCDGNSNTISTTVLTQASTPTITSDSLNICPGKKIKLVSSNSTFNIWSTGETSQSILVATAGEVSLKANNEFGCQSGIAVVKTNLLPQPPQPTIIPDSLSFCPEKGVQLTSNNTLKNLWSTGEALKNIKVFKGGEYTLKAINSQGCESEAALIKLESLPTPPNPEISADSLVFCPGKSLNLKVNQLEYSPLWSTGSKTNAISVLKAGDYSVQFVSKRGCKSQNSTIKITTFPQPSAPIISAASTTSFCDGGSVDLNGSLGKNFLWSNGLTTQKIVAKTSGTYTLSTVDKNGCASVPSNSIIVNVKPLPNTPTITQTGTYTLELLNDGLKGELFEWRRDGDLLPFQTSIIKASKTGFYSAKSYIEYIIPNGPPISCSSGLSVKFQFNSDLYADGLSVYPNPSLNGLIYIETQDDIEEVNVSLISISGHVLFSTNVNKFNTRQVFDFSQYPRGFYILRITGKSYNSIRRVLLEH